MIEHIFYMYCLGMRYCNPMVMWNLLVYQADCGLRNFWMRVLFTGELVVPFPYPSVFLVIFSAPLHTICWLIVEWLVELAVGKLVKSWYWILVCVTELNDESTHSISIGLWSCEELFWWGFDFLAVVSWANLFQWIYSFLGSNHAEHWHRSIFPTNGKLPQSVHTSLKLQNACTDEVLSYPAMNIIKLVSFW